MRPRRPRAAQQTFDYVEVPPSIAAESGEAKWLVDALRALDARLGLAVEAVEALFGPGAARDHFRGLHVTPSDAERTLRRTAIAPLFGPVGRDEALVELSARGRSRLHQLRDGFALSPVDLDVILIALAPEIDLRYERLYGFVQDDVAKKRPTIDLALNLVSASVARKLEHLRRFEADAPLVRHGLVRVGSKTDSSGIARPFTLDPAVLQYLLGHPAIDPSIAADAHVLVPRLAKRRGRTTRASSKRGEVFYVQGTDRRALVQRAGTHAGGRAVLAVDADLFVAPGVDWESALAAMLRSARLERHVLVIHGGHVLWAPERETQLRHLLRRLAEHPDAVYLTGDDPWRAIAVEGGAAVIPLEHVPADAHARARMWQRELGSTRLRPDLDDVATAFELTHAQVADAAHYARQLATWRGDESPARDDLFAAARAQTRGTLSGLAERFEVKAGWSELVLPDEVIGQLQELVLRVSHRETVLDAWGFGRKRTYGLGTPVLFAGPSGTGKTFAAGVLAQFIGLDIYRIDLASVVSKYIGETEKNLKRLFDAAQGCNAILLFDEADALYGKRSQVRDAHDRYANQELAYLLQRIEQFQGLAILTTNMPGSIDDAFRRRIAATIHFPLPDERMRLKLWQRVWPESAPLAPDMHLGELARTFKISGGVIAKAALGAGYLAAKAGSPIAMHHVLHALRRELEGVGLAMPISTVRAAESPAAAIA